MHIGHCDQFGDHGRCAGGLWSDGGGIGDGDHNCLVYVE